MPTHSARPAPHSRYATERPVPPATRRRPAVVLALLIGLLVAGVTPAAAVGRGTTEATRVTTTAAAPAQQTVYRQASSHAAPAKTVLAGKTSKSKKRSSKSGIKGLVGFLILLLFFGLLFVGLVIWVVVRTKRRAALEQRNG
ncbi:hypothetical protein [Streptomyces sp. NPDC053427]|uniref:hypothetical protein n=1 Tax=Streptomyces sp. NPDC053427 TaxID=3365701 RepID=UPI0037D93DD9